MEHISALQNNCPISLSTWKYITSNNKFRFSKTLNTKPFNHLRHLPALHQANDSTKDKNLLVESYHEHQTLNFFLVTLNKKGSSPLQMLLDDGDWSIHQFWAVIRFLNRSSRSFEILQVFDMWKDIDKTRINESNYEKIIGVLCEESLMEDAYSAFCEMRSFGLSPSLKIYNSIIHGYSATGKFDDALFYINQMKEANLAPEADTYDGLIQAYGKRKMYDEINMCLKKMEVDGCSPDHITYNLLIREFAQAGLLTRMERVYQSMRTKKMDLQSYTLISMLKAYVNYGIVEKMEKILRRVLNSRARLKEDLVRKIAMVYIENLMFSRLDNLGKNLCSRSGPCDTVWCLRLLYSACTLSRKGMESVVEEMEEAKVSWNVTFVNIILLAYLKMKDFPCIRILLSKFTDQLLKPDLVTVGILLDANSIGFYGTETLETWKRMGFLYRIAEIDTDPLVLTAFGKGQFLRKCEEAYSSLEPNARERKWTYYNLIDLVSKSNWKQSQLKVNE